MVELSQRKIGNVFLIENLQRGQILEVPEHTATVPMRVIYRTEIQSTEADGRKYANFLSAYLSRNSITEEAASGISLGIELAPKTGQNVLTVFGKVNGTPKEEVIRYITNIGRELERNYLVKQKSAPKLRT